MKQLIKFKSMQEILLTESAYFDKYGNLCVNSITRRGETDHIAPSYFSYLGKLREFKRETNFPHWCIEYITGNSFSLRLGLENLKESITNEDELEVIDNALDGKIFIRRCDNGN